LNNFQALKIGKSRNHLLKNLQLTSHIFQSLLSSSPMSQTSQICMCGACNASYYNIFFAIQKTLNKRNSYEKVKVLVAMCKVIWILKNIPQHKNSCLQRGANGKNVNHVFMK